MEYVVESVVSMDHLNNKTVPQEAVEAVKIIEELLGGVVGVYLFGSAVMGGLRPNSDVDLLVMVNHSLSEKIRRKLSDRLMRISGRVGNTDSKRPLEVTVVNRQDIVPWQYPPKKEFTYGEWLRYKFEQGWVPEPTIDPDLAIVLHQVRKNSVPLVGRDAAETLDPVPSSDLQRAMKESLPGLLKGIKGDERNVILTLARMWLTAAVGDFQPKDVAAAWAIPRLPKEQGALLDIARKAYRGEGVDQWEGLESQVKLLTNQMKQAIESSLGD